MRSFARRGARSTAWALAAAGLALGGCSTLLAVSEQQERADATCVISGSVAADYPARGPLVVGLVARGGADYVVVDHFVSEKPGPFLFAVVPGTYWLAAFEDADGDGRYAAEPALRPDPAQPLVLAAGEVAKGIELRIPRDGRFRLENFTLRDLEARSSAEQQRASVFAMSVAGEVTSLDDPRFGPDVVSQGMWRFYDFLLAGRPGIYFLEPYDPRKIPVLFVHGIEGSPAQFAPLVAALDRERFQPWVYYYPSGAYLEGVAGLLRQLFVRLRVEHRFERVAVVAHSMGGLVTRRFLLEDFAASGTRAVRTYVTISSPLGGMASAAEGVERSPVVVRSWEGLAPGSPFLEGLFYRDPAKATERLRLPEHMAYHMLFGFHGGDSSDGVVALASQLRPEAQEEARSLRGFDATHTGILASPAAAARLGEILAELR